MKFRLASIAVLALAAAGALAQDNGAAPASKGGLKTAKQRASYAIGASVGSNLKRDGIQADLKALLQGIQDALDGELALKPEELQEAIEGLSKQLAEDRKQAGEDFLAANQKKEGVKVTKSGLQYKVLKAGKGKKPTRDDVVSVDYRGTLIDGTQFDSSYDRGQPATFPVNRVIPGWTEALQLMTEGSKWQLAIPANLAYGENGAPPDIGPNATLLFEVELHEIKPAKSKLPTVEDLPGDEQPKTKRPAGSRAKAAE